MQTLKAIRSRLDLTQEALGKVIGLTKARVSQLESGSGRISPAAARLLIDHAATQGVRISFDDIYSATAGTEKAAA